MDFLQVSGKTYLITGVANKKSVAFFTAKVLMENGAKVIFSCQNEDNQKKAQKLFPDSSVLICDVEDQGSIDELGEYMQDKEIKLSGFVHSIAFANYSEGIKPFHETKVPDFLQATNISCLSLITLTNTLKESFLPGASIVTISISSTRATSYGYMGPIKAALEATVDFLAKSLSEISTVRVNSVCAGPLKTSASAGIPGYIENYLYAEQLTLRKEALKTIEVANTVSFLLSPMSSGINATGVVVDAGMGCNYFDQKLVHSVAKNL